MGPASWRWVEQAYASWQRLEAPGALEAVQVPVLLISTAADKLVSHPANLRAAARLPKAELLALGDEAFLASLQKQTDRRLTRGRPGRPPRTPRL